MANFRLGVVLEPLGLPPRKSFERAASLGAICVQFDVAGDLRPEALTQTGRREVKTILRSLGLQLAAVQVPLRRGLDVADDQQERIDHIRKAIDFAGELGAGCLVIPCPKLPADSETARSKVLKETLAAIGLHGLHRCAAVALECGIDSAETLEVWLTPEVPLQVAFDPANFLANGHDPIAVLSKLARHIVHVQARDVRSGTLSGGAKEVAVGAGDVEWIPLVATLDAYDELAGVSVVVDREDGPQRALDVENGLKFLRRFAGPITG